MLPIAKIKNWSKTHESTEPFTLLIWEYDHPDVVRSEVDGEVIRRVEQSVIVEEGARRWWVGYEIEKSNRMDMVRDEETIGVADTREEAERLAVEWMRDHPEGVL